MTYTEKLTAIFRVRFVFWRIKMSAGVIIHKFQM